MATLDRRCKIYTLSDPITGQIRYVGQTVLSLRLRLLYHMSESRQPIYTHKTNWIRSILQKGLEPKIELLEFGVWNEDEMYWIEQFKQWGFNLVNGTIGGDGTAGKPLSEEHRKKIADAHRGRKLTLEFRNKLSKAHAGKPRPWKKKKFQLTDEFGKIIIITGSKEVASFLNCNRVTIHKVVSGKRNSVFGYKIVKI
jgi:hypothetical protein